jgi:small GTP-binding protein
MIQKKICLIGAFAVGKTSLISRFVHQKFSEDYLTTLGVKVDRAVLDVDGDEVKLMVWDLAGEDEYQSVKMSYLKGAAGYLLVIDGTRRSTLATAIELKRRIDTEVGVLPFVCLVNKSDLATQWELTEADYAADLGSWMAVNSSAKTGEGVIEGFATLARAIL